MVDERIHEMLRLAAVRAYKNPFAASNGADRRLGGNDLVLIRFCHTLPPLNEDEFLYQVPVDAEECQHCADESAQSRQFRPVINQKGEPAAPEKPGPDFDSKKNNIQLK